MSVQLELWVGKFRSQTRGLLALFLIFFKFRAGSALRPTFCNSSRILGLRLTDCLLFLLKVVDLDHNLVE